MHDVDGINIGFTRALYEEYLEERDRIPSVWREFFENGAGDAVVAVTDQPDELTPAAVAAAMSLVMAHRTHGHLTARLDPLASEPVRDPTLEPDRYVPMLTSELQARIPAALLGLSLPAESLADALPRLRETYCGTIAYEIEHIASQQQRVWLRQAIESGRHRRPLAPEDKKRLLERLSRVETFERFLRRKFIGQKQFSIEGLDVVVPMLDAAIEVAAEAGTRKVVIGMAHRGRLNVLAHVVGRPYDEILRRFEGARTLVADREGGTGDVKYHLGGNGMRPTAAGEIAITILPNPSHLEAVDPVVGGFARAEQTDRSTNTGLHDPSVVLPVLVHGDASFAGQGVVAETFNLAGLSGYTTGGTLHVIANNQVGFTTEPSEGRSTRYPSDLAKGFDVPIVHVNADDSEAALSAVRLGMAYREEFRRDFVIDLVGYRRLGHNEQDDPSYTQPLMAARIETHPTARALYARRLRDEGIVSVEEADDLVDSVEEELRSAHEGLQAARGGDESAPGARAQTRTAPAVVTAVPDEQLRALDEELVRVPSGFAVNPKLAQQLERRRQALDEGGIDWGHAEALAFASIVVEGIPIRLAGQDSQRGTFSHRQLVLHDPTSGETYSPIQHLPGANASLEVYNSPLSEYAALGFEYGYSVAAPDALVLWEAQFGDFVNGAQIIVDQFIVAGRAKWGQTSRLTLLLPHGYEGNGPEHSSARLERFLQSAAEGNVRIAIPSTAAQYFHLLRRQALDPQPRPLIVMTPKGLLRSRGASANLRELTAGAFAPVLADGTVEHEDVRRLVLCSGKLYYEIAAHEERARLEHVAIARLEELYPFPEHAVAELTAAHPAIEELVWAQEEPLNMGAYRSIRHRLENALPAGVPLRYVGRPWRASPSEGDQTAHGLEQERVVREGLGVPHEHVPHSVTANARPPARSSIHRRRSSAMSRRYLRTQ